jgi:2-dehydropantoate 2-reductase
VAGFETELSADVERLIWRKLAVNCAINPLSVVRGTTNGALLDRQEDREEENRRDWTTCWSSRPS